MLNRSRLADDIENCYSPKEVIRLLGLQQEQYRQLEEEYEMVKNRVAELWLENQNLKAQLNKVKGEAIWNKKPF